MSETEYLQTLQFICWFNSQRDVSKLPEHEFLMYEAVCRSVQAFSLLREAMSKRLTQNVESNSDSGRVS